MLSNGDMQEAFDRFDTDGNGLICAAELKKVCDMMTEGEDKEVGSHRGSQARLSTQSTRAGAAATSPCSHRLADIALLAWLPSCHVLASHRLTPRLCNRTR